MSSSSYPHNTVSSPGKTSGSIRAIALILLAAVIMLYARTFGNGFILYDDPDYITANDTVTAGITLQGIRWAFTTFTAGNWHPLTWLSHMLDVQLFGLDPSWHHATSAALHSSTTLLLFLLLQRLTGHQWRSAVVAALFAVHPLHVESVAWAAERKDVLSGFFWVLTLYCHTRYASGKRGWYPAALGSFALGLMAKPMLVTLPLIMLLLDLWPLGRYRPPLDKASAGGLTAPQLIREKLPFAGLSLASAVVTLFAQHAGGAIKTFQAVPVPFRIENALVSLTRYIGALFLPGDLAVLYPLPAAYPLWQVAGSAVILLAVTIAAIRVRHRFPYLAVGWFWFIIALLPVIGLVQVGVQALADRYTYLPSIGLFISVVWGISDLLSRWSLPPLIRAVPAGTALAALSLITWQQTGYWRDSITLYRHTLEVTTGNYVIHNNLGSALASSWQLEPAIAEFREALRIWPGYAEAHYNLGMAYAMSGAADSAAAELREALRLSPGHIKARHFLGKVQEQQRLLQPPR